MLVFKSGFERALSWMVDADDPEVLPLAEPAGWSVVNPLVPAQPMVVAGCSAWRLESGKALVASQELNIAVRQRSESDAESLESFLATLRYATGQADLPLQPAVTAYVEIDHLPSVVWPGELDAGSLVPVPYVRDTAITFDALSAASASLVSGPVPVYGILLLDAIAAERHSDFQKAILYAAIAVETMASTLLDVEYERILDETPSATSHRVVYRTVEGCQRPQDPIYRALRKARRGNVSYLLHELPLYVLRRSLLVDNEHLYQGVRRLQDTRNKLVHEGSVQEEAKSITLDREGALEALSTARRAFEWFNAPGRYVLPDGPGVAPETGTRGGTAS